MNASMGKKIATTALALGLGLAPLAGCNSKKADTGTAATTQQTQSQSKTVSGTSSTYVDIHQHAPQDRS